MYRYAVPLFKRMSLGIVMGLASLAIAAPCSVADTWVWTGQSTVIDETDNGLAQLFPSPFGVEIRGSLWNAGIVRSDRNWSVNGEQVLGVPGSGDSVVFGPNFPNGHPLSSVNRTIKDLTLNASSNVGLDFATGLTTRQLTLESGRLTRTSNSSSDQVIRADILNAQPALWDIGGSGSLHISGQVATQGSFTKTGSARLRFFRDVLTTGPFIVNDGEVIPLFALHSPSLIIGDGVGNSKSAILQKYDPTFYSSVTINSDGRLDLDTESDILQLRLNGGTLTKFFSDLRVWNVGSIEVTDDSEITVQFNGGILNMEPAVVVLTTSAPVVVNAGSTLRLDHTILSADSLTLRGGGTLKFQGVEANQISGLTTVESGELVLDRSESPVVVGSVTLGQHGASAPARLTQLRSNQIADNATLTIYPGGEYNLSNGISETIYGLHLLGGAVSTGTADLSLLDPSTFVGGSQATSSISGRLGFGGQSHRFDVETTSTLVASARLSDGSLTKSSPGTLRLAGAQANELTSLTLEAGRLELAKSAGVNAVGSDLIVGTTNQTSGGPTLEWEANDQIPDGLIVKFRSGLIDLNGHSETIGGLNAFGSGAMNVAASGGMLGVSGNSIAFAGARANVNGKVDLGGGTRSFEARGDSALNPNFTNWAFTGPINNGTFRKTGVGRVEFANSFGNAVLEMAAGSATIAGAARFGGLAGTGAVDNAAGLELIVPSGQTYAYSGVLGGAGYFAKSGPGTQRLEGSAANTMTGNVTVTGGVLQLNKTGGPALNGNLTVAARVEALRPDQFGASSRVNVRQGGVLDATAGPQGVASLNIDTGRADTDVLVVVGDVSVKNGALTTELLIGAGDLAIDLHGAVSAVGGVAGRAQLAASGVLTVPRTGPVGLLSSGFFVGGGLHAEADSRIVLKPGQPSDQALLTVEEGMLVGAPQKTPGGNTLVGMLGAATVDLSQSGPLSPGVYKLIDFSESPYTEPGVGGAIYPTLANFSTIGPQSTPGAFSVIDSVLQFTVSALPGDFDEDGDVDGSDLTLWSAGFGKADAALHGDGDADGDVDVDGTDFLIWQQQLGSSTTVSLSSPVPEPAAWRTLLLALLAIRTCVPVGRPRR